MTKTFFIHSDNPDFDTKLETVIEEWTEGHSHNLAISQIETSANEKGFFIVLNYVLLHLKTPKRPISDLYETISHRGEEFVPMIELAKMVAPKKVSVFSISPSPNGGFVTFSVSTPDKLDGWRFAKGEFFQYIEQGFFTLKVDEENHAINQKMLFDKLEDWGFELI